MYSDNLGSSLTVGIVIPAYDEEKAIATVLESVVCQTRPVDQVIVVDDCSQDMTAKIARSYKEVDVISPEVNQGTKAQAQNFALPYVKTDIVITIDGDTILAPDAVEEILKVFSGDSHVVAACGFIIPKKIRTLWEKGRFVEYLFGITLYKNIQKEYNAMIVCSGCFSAFDTKTLIEHGGFKKRTMAEDMDLTWSYVTEGRKVIYVPDAVCYPIEPESFRIFRAQIRRWYRSFFQNIAIHKKPILKFTNPFLSMFILLGLLDGLMFPFMLIFFLALPNYLKINAAILLLIFDLFTVMIPTMIKGYKIKRLKLAFFSIPYFLFITRWINLIYFWESLFKEWVLRDRLTVWEKGH